MAWSLACAATISRWTPASTSFASASVRPNSAMSTRPSGRLISTTSAHHPSPSAPISTSLKTQATDPPSVRERAPKYPTAVAPPISRRSPRGSLTVWFTPEAIAAWQAEPRTTRGGQPTYSDLAIATALALRAVFRLALRQTEGLIGSVLQRLGLDLPVPDHSTLSRRAETLEVPCPKAGSAPVHLLVDSTGLKLCGPGEWLTEKHGTKRRRAWRVLHLAMDADTGRIVASVLTDKEADDGCRRRPPYRSAPRRRSGRCRRPSRDAALSRPGVAWCRASRSATRPGRTASARCCPPAGAPARSPPSGTAPPASRPGGSGSSGPAPGDRGRDAAGQSRSAPRSGAAPGGTPPAAPGPWRSPDRSRWAARPGWCAVRPATPRSPPA